MKQNYGFSLLELSIVLVIIGLIAGGIVAGSSMIRAAELRSVITDIQRYKTSIYTFRDKYFALPGDMRNAYDFWGVEAGCTDTDSNTNIAGCNGNGDSHVSSVSNAESARFWQHLALANLVEGSYSGIWGSGDYLASAKIDNALWTAKSWTYLTTHGWVGTGGSQGLELSLSTSLTAEEMWNIDKKIDDGRAPSGKIYPHATVNGGLCVTGTSIATDDYNFGAVDSCILLARF